MTGWTCFILVVGVVFLTAQLFRLIDLIERPAPRPCRQAARRHGQTSVRCAASGRPQPRRARGRDSRLGRAA